MTDAQILNQILAHEGSTYTDDPFDHGRCTRFGITRVTLEDWRGHPVTCADVKALTEVEAREIYTARYLRPFDGIDPEVKPQIVDIAVNAGVFRARALLALAEQGDKPLNTQLVIERLKHYGRIVKADTSQAKYLGGWINRAVSYL